MKVCNHCQGELTFSCVMKSPNPARFKCTHCKHVIRVHLFPMALSFVAAAILSLAFVVFALEIALAQIALLAGLIAVGFMAEYAYYQLIKRGVIGSSLTTLEDNP